jgi:hypothetical protein
MTNAQKIAARFNLTLGRLTNSDTRRIVNHESKPFYIANDGRIIKQFGTPKERTEWLSGYEDVQDLPPIPDPKPMSID